MDKTPTLRHDDGKFTRLRREFIAVGAADVLLDEMLALP